MQAATAAGPATLNYQGFLTDQKSGVPVNASVSVTFKLCDALTGGNVLYTETQSLSATNGMINAQIGSVTAFPATLAFDKPYWLEVTVGSDTLTPRQAVASSAFAQSTARMPTQAGYNTGGGDGALAKLANGIGNTAFGAYALSTLTGGTLNTAIGNAALPMLKDGIGNTVVGQSAAPDLQVGNENIYIGHNTGWLVQTESGTIRIGDPRPLSGIQRAFMAGVRGVAVHDDGQPVVIDSFGQLGNVPGISLTSAGLAFGSTTRQMLNLWNTNYGIGVQDITLYMRSDSDFTWYTGGTHNNARGNPGGGKYLMGLSGAGLRVVGSDSTGANDITLLADGSIHAKVVNTTSDRNAKENFADIDPREVLAKVAQLPLHTWNYKGDANTVKHLGPVAQDFQSAFHVGTDDKYIATVDADGVALAAIQGLYHMVQEKDAELAQVKAQLTRLKQSVDWMIAHGAGPTQVVMH